MRRLEGAPERIARVSKAKYRRHPPGPEVFAGGLAAEATVLVVPASASAVGATAQAFYGNLHVDDGLLVGVPAVGGVLLGTWLQQRVSMRVISALFSLLLTALAVDLVVTA